MGILRADRITGIGGANAITGSVRFHGNQDDLQLLPSADFDFGTGDYTIEAWVYPLEFGRSQMIFAVHNADSTAAAGKFYFRSTNKFTYWSENAARIVSSTTYTESKWYHVALVNNSGTQTIYVDGTSQGTSTYGNGFGSDTFVVHIGRNAANDNQSMNGYISNIRVTKGTALYTSAFTPPTTRLIKRSDTVLLACNSASNVLNEETGKVIQSVRASTNNSGAKASRFTPNSPVGFSTTTDVGGQYGTTFDGFGSFATSTYMVPPGGNTRERNRGRAVIGWANNPVTTGMDVFNIQSMGNSTVFGNLTSGNKWGSHAFSSTTRGLWAGGYLNSGPAFYNIIEFVTIANNGNPIDFGDTTSQNYRSGCCSSSTRGVIALGFVAPNFSIVNTIDQVTMATAGNATNFGDLFQTRSNMASTSSPTRGIFAGGTTPANQGTIDFVTIASAGDAQDFGDLQEAVSSPMALASSTRGIIGGGYPAPANTNVINFITIASAGNAQDFGDLTGLYSVGSAVSNKTRGVFTGGYTAPSKHNLMEFVTISTTGNASDFGDMTYARRDFGACSDSHGGL